MSRGLPSRLIWRRPDGARRRGGFCPAACLAFLYLRETPMSNTYATRAQRQATPPDALDWFGTPPWGGRALCEHVLTPNDWLGASVWEPACGDGSLARGLGDYFQSVITTDVFDYSDQKTGHSMRCHDFLMPFVPDYIVNFDFIITNPPFVLATQFARRALQFGVPVALLTRLQWVETEERYNLFREHRPDTVAVFSCRCPINKGAAKRGDGTATAYCWVVWRREPASKMEFMQIPPSSREMLEKWGDYPGETGVAPVAMPKTKKKRAA